MSFDCSAPPSAVVAEWVQNGGFILISYALMINYNGLAHVCEEYFVPALEVLCEEWKIPPNVAGATFMAIGTSAPDVFVSLFGLFVTHSSIGIGTVVGSAVFNHMVICAACVMSNGKDIALNPIVFTREVLAYMLALFLLIFTLGDDILHGDTFSSSKWKYCLRVNTVDAFDMMLWYGVYVLGTFVTGDIVTYCLSVFQMFDKQVSDDIAVQRQRKRENTISLAQQPSHLMRRPSFRKIGLENAMMQAKDDISSLRSTLSVVSLSRQSFSQASNSFDGIMIGCPIINNVKPTQSRDGFDCIPVDTDIPEDVPLPPPPEGFDELPLSDHLWMARLRLVMYFLNLPMTCIIDCTLPKCNTPDTRKQYLKTSFLCIIWLGIMSEIIVECIGVLGEMVGASQALMGFTLSSIGASLPSIWSSMMVARRGEGDMAISNALGANTFSILVGLGFPWLLYTIVYQRSYSGIQDGGIVLLLIVLIIVLVFFYFLVFANAWSLKYWMGPLFLGVYGCVIALCCYTQSHIRDSGP